MEKISQYLPTKLEKSQFLPIVSIAAATTLLYASYRLVSSSKKTATKQGYKEIPVPGSAYPYIGHILSLGQLPGKTISEFHKELGPIIRLKMGVQNWIMVDDPKLAHKIFVTQGIETSYRPEAIFTFSHYSLKGKGIVFSQPTAAWKKARIAALSILAPKQIENYTSSIFEESSRLVDGFIESTLYEGSTDPTHYLELNSMNVICSVAFGIKYKSVRDPEFIEVVTMIEDSIKLAAIENDLANFLPILSFVDYFAGSQVKMKNIVKTRIEPTFRKLIKEANDRQGPNLVKSLQEDGIEFTEDDKRVFFSDLVNAGTDTISVTLSWNIVLMCHYPEVQKTAADEIDGFIKTHGRLPLFKDRLELPYCLSVIKECMRFKPTSPFGQPHTVIKDIEVDGYIIPAGSSIISNLDSMHRNAEFYPEPDRFFAERFMNNPKTMYAAANGKLEERDQFNFGWGRRICPAIYLAETQIFSAFVHILARCKIEATEQGLPDINSAKNAGLTILPLPYKVKFTKRADYLI